MGGLADNDVAGGRKQKILQKMKKIVREACDEICQYVCDHKTNFSPIKGTEINPDCRINHFCCPVACADIYCSKMDREDEAAEEQECECFIHMRDGVVWCEK